MLPSWLRGALLLQALSFVVGDTSHFAEGFAYALRSMPKDAKGGGTGSGTGGGTVAEAKAEAKAEAEAEAQAQAPPPAGSANRQRPSVRQEPAIVHEHKDEELGA